MTVDIFPKLVKEEEQWQIARQLAPVVESTNDYTTFIREDVVSAGIVAQGSEYPTDRTDNTEVPIVLKKLGITVIIPYDWVEDKNYDLISQKTRAGIRAVMRQENKLFIDTMLAATGITSNAADDSGNLNIPDLSEAINAIEDNGYPADSLVLHPDQAEDMRNRGELETIERQLSDTYSLKTFITDDIATGTALVMNSTNAARLVVRRDLDRVESYNGIQDEWVYKIDERVAPVVIRAGLISVITSC